MRQNDGSKEEFLDFFRGSLIHHIRQGNASMYKLLAFLVMLTTACLLQAEPEKKEFTPEQLDKLKAAEEKYKDNPAIMNIIEKTKNSAGLTEENEKPETSRPASTEPKIQGSASVAKKAYANKDYATAFENYKALAETGDADAPLILGTMYEQGRGTEKDPVAAYAWYRKAGDESGGNFKELLPKIEKRELSEEEIMEVDKRYEAINKELAEGQAAEKKSIQTAADPLAATADQKIIFMLNRDLLATGQDSHTSATSTSPASGAVYTPQKLNPMQHYQPEKFRSNTP